MPSELMEGVELAEQGAHQRQPADSEMTTDNVSTRSPATADVSTTTPAATQAEPGQTPGTTTAASTASEEPKRKRRKKVIIACVYCRRSHMICDEQRPCSRCIKRNIGHLCHDEPASTKQKKRVENSISGKESTDLSAKALANVSTKTPAALDTTAVTSQPQIKMDSNVNAIVNQTSTTNLTPTLQHLEVQSVPQHLQSQLYGDGHHSQRDLSKDSSAMFNQQPFFFSEHAGSEFSSLNEFLSMLDDPELIGSGGQQDPNNHGSLPHSNNLSASHSLTNLSLTNMSMLNSPALNSYQFLIPQQPQLQPQQQQQSQSQQHQLHQHQQQQLHHQQQQQLPHGSQVLHNFQAHDQSHALPPPQQHISDSARDKFFLTAADPSTEISPEERLKQVINAKLEAGLLQPYNYAKGYARLQAYMDNYMNSSSKQRILKPLSIFRPAFRAIARTLKDVDLILVEENFERMLLDYDRVFTSMAIPACLWRRTGEIYRGNKEFASLVEVAADDLKDGKLAIYELMSEESAVNFWEKYGAIAFDKGQKAVLTSCNLRTRDGRKRKTCCFSFTIRRDRYNIPSCIVGNFIPINP